MRCETAAVFGGSGKIGRRVVSWLANQGVRTRVLQHKTPIPGTAIERVPGSVTDAEAVREVIRGCDIVVHLATAKEDKETFFDVGLRGTFHVLEACREEGVQQLILLGGDAAFGIWFYPQPIPIDENHPYMAYPGYYAFTKVIEEAMARQYTVQYGLPVTVLRSSWVFTDDDILRHFSLLENLNPAEEGHGFGDVPQNVWDLVSEQQERIPILTDATGTPLRRHIVHIDDLMRAFSRAFGNSAALNTSFNIAGPAPFSYDVAARYLSEKVGIPTIELNTPDYHSFEINITRARSVLGYAPDNDIFRMIDRALAWRS